MGREMMGRGEEVKGSYCDVLHTMCVHKYKYSDRIDKRKNWFLQCALGGRRVIAGKKS